MGQDYGLAGQGSNAGVDWGKLLEMNSKELESCLKQKEPEWARSLLDRISTEFEQNNFTGFSLACRLSAAQPECERRVAEIMGRNLLELVRSPSVGPQDIEPCILQGANPFAEDSEGTSWIGWAIAERNAELTFKVLESWLECGSDATFELGDFATLDGEYSKLWELLKNVDGGQDTVLRFLLRHVNEIKLSDLEELWTEWPVDFRKDLFSAVAAAEDLKKEFMTWWGRADVTPFLVNGFIQRGSLRATVGQIEDGLGKLATRVKARGGVPGLDAGESQRVYERFNRDLHWCLACFPDLGTVERDGLLIDLGLAGLFCGAQLAETVHATTSSATGRVVTEKETSPWNFLVSTMDEQTR